MKHSDRRYRLKISGLRLVEQGGIVGLVREGSRRAVEVPTKMKAMLSWVLERGRFSRKEIANAFPAHDTPAIELFLAESVRMGIVAPDT